MNKKLHQFLIVALGAASVGLAGCQTFDSSKWSGQMQGKIDAELDASRATPESAAVPSDVSKALLPPLEVNVPNGKVTPLDTRFDLSVSSASARQVFLGLVEGTPYDVVVQPNVGGLVTLNLKDVTVPEAFNAMRDAYGYEYRREGNRFVVLGRELQTRIFPINYLNLIRKGSSETRTKSSDISNASSGTTSSATSGSTSGDGGSKTSVETTTQSDFWKDITEALIAIVGTDGGRKVIINKQTGMALVRAMPDELRGVENYLGATHASVNRQVVLEAKIIEVELSDRFQTGINWSGVTGNYTVSQIGGGTSNLSTIGASPIAGTIGPLGAITPNTGSITNAFGGVFTVAAIGSDFSAFLELLKAQGDTQVLSSPRVSTVNNQKAIIKVGGDEFFVTGVRSGTTTSGSSTTTIPEVTLTAFFSGIVLDVTPQIDADDNIILHIHPSVGTVSERIKSVIIAGDQFSLPTAFSTIEESDNIVRARSSQIIVIGGLMKEGTTDDNAAVPFLGDVPVLGNLFKHKRVTRIKKELVILLKPTIIQLDKDWNGAVGESQERIKKIRVGS